jgi:hypothetical protein
MARGVPATTAAGPNGDEARVEQHSSKAEGDGCSSCMCGDPSPLPSKRLVSRFRSSHHCAAHSFANFGIKGTLAIYDSGAVLDLKFLHKRAANDRNFKSTARGHRALTALHAEEGDVLSPAFADQNPPGPTGQAAAPAELAALLKSDMQQGGPIIQGGEHQGRIVALVHAGEATP